MEHLPVATPIGGEVVISVTIPNGVLPGQPLNVQAPDGRMFQIIVPQDVRAGQTINVVVDNSAQSGSSTTMAAGGGSSSAMSMPPVNPTDPRSNRAAIGAAAAAAVAGTLIIGPVTGVCVAGAALYATTREDEVGQIARQAGSAACYAYDTAKQNGVFDKLMSAGKATLDKAKALNNEYKITDRVAQGVQDFDREHRATERLGQAAMQAAARTPGAVAAVISAVASSSAASSASGARVGAGAASGAGAGR